MNAGNRDRSDVLVVIFAASWLAFLIYPALGVIRGHRPGAAIALPAAATALSAAVYLRAVGRIAFDGVRRPPWAEAIALSAIALAPPFAFGPGWVGLLIYVALIAGLTMRGAALAASVILSAALTAITGAATGAPAWQLLALVLVTLLGGAAARGIGWLRAVNGELRATRARIAEMAGREARLHLARELHDSVKQQVFVASMEIAAAAALLEAAPSKAGPHVDEASRAIRQVQADLDALVRELRPLPPGGVDLERSVRAHANGWAARTRISVEVRVDGDPRVPQEVERSLFRVVQEALTNIEKHSGATSAAVSLRRAQGRLEVAIADDGRGFDAADGRARGQGLLNIRERLRSLNGSARIESSPGRGTRIACVCPLPDDKEDRSA
jgi:signal transduction histidine kinase